MSPLLARRRPWQPPRYCQEDIILTVATVATIMYVGAVLLTVDSEPLMQTSLSHADTAASVVVVTGQGSADSVIAESLGGTVLHIPQSGVSRAIRVQLRRLDPTHVVVLGGMQAVTATTLADVEASTSASVTRVAGPDRYATAARAATLTFRAPVQQVFVTTAAVPQQALEAARRASSATPLLLVDRDSVPATTTAALRQLRPRSVVVLGDAAVVSDPVMRQLRTSVEGDVERFSGAG